jgi:pimeloyl-ACP methyl ester carboxylesterase
MTALGITQHVAELVQNYTVHTCITLDEDPPYQDLRDQMIQYVKGLVNVTLIGESFGGSVAIDISRDLPNVALTIVLNPVLECPSVVVEGLRNKQAFKALLRKILEGGCFMGVFNSINNHVTKHPKDGICVVKSLLYSLANMWSVDLFHVRKKVFGLLLPCVELIKRRDVQRDRKIIMFIGTEDNVLIHNEGLKKTFPTADIHFFNDTGHLITADKASIHRFLL